MQPPFDIAADLDTPVSAYLKLAPFGPRFLLESVEGGERIGRFSFIGFGDGTVFRLQGDSLKTGSAEMKAPRDRESLLVSLRDALDRTPRPGPVLPGLNYTGGLVGVTGYDLVRRLRNLPARDRPGDFPEAIFAAPRSILVFDHLTLRVALLHDGDDSERLVLRREVIATLRGLLPGRPRHGGFKAPTPSLDTGAWMSAVRRAQDHITAGDIYQLVLSIRFSGETQLDPFEVYRALRLLNPSPYMYYCDFGDIAVVGSSPEALVRLEGGAASLRRIAGTSPRGAGAGEDARLERELRADPKENAEHVMLVDLARNDLGRVAVTGSVEVDPYMAVERYSHVMHLVSGVR